MVIPYNQDFRIAMCVLKGSFLGMIGGLDSILKNEIVT